MDYHTKKVLVSKDLGPDELVVGLEDLKDINILHKEFPKTLPEWKREDARQVNAQYNSIRGDQWNEQMEVQEKRKRARGVLLHLKEQYEAVDKKIQTLSHSLKRSRWSWISTSMCLAQSCGRS